MIKSIAIVVSAFTFLTLCTPSSAQKKKPSQKPAAAKSKKAPAKKTAAAKPGGPIVLGTTQLPGDFGKLGQTYTIGKSQPVNFTLNSAEYTVMPFISGGNWHGPTAEQKLLMLHYTVHNPRPSEFPYSWSAIRFTAVDASDTNRTYITAVNREGTTDNLSLSLKPAQKVGVVAAIMVPAAGVVPKLIVECEQGAPVIRYDLRGKVKALPEPFADPADSAGASARKEVPVPAGVFASMAAMDMRLDEVAFTTEALGRAEPQSGGRLVTAVFTIKNRGPGTLSYAWSTFNAVLKDTDGEKTEYNQVLLKARRDEPAQGNLAPGEEAKVRFAFPLPKDVAPKSLSITENSVVSHETARVFVFDLGGKG